MLQNKVLTNIEQNLSEQEKSTARKNIGVYNPGDGRLRLLNDDGAIIGDFTADQDDNTDITISRELLDVYSTSQVDAKIPHKPVVFNLGTSIYEANPLLSGESNSSLQYVIGTIPNSIQLDANKTYLIQPNVFGTAEYTMQVNAPQQARFSLRFYLIPESGWVYSDSICIADAQFNCKNSKGSANAGYHFNVTIGSNNSLYTPSHDIIFSKVIIVNSGNILGTSSSNEGRCFMDFNLGSLVITEM